MGLEENAYHVIKCSGLMVNSIGSVLYAREEQTMLIPRKKITLLGAEEDKKEDTHLTTIFAGEHAEGEIL